MEWKLKPRPFDLESSAWTTTLAMRMLQDTFVMYQLQISHLDEFALLVIIRGSIICRAEDGNNHFLQGFPQLTCILPQTENNDQTHRKNTQWQSIIFTFQTTPSSIALCNKLNGAVTYLLLKHPSLSITSYIIKLCSDTFTIKTIQTTC